MKRFYHCEVCPSPGIVKTNDRGKAYLVIFSRSSFQHRQPVIQMPVIIAHHYLILISDDDGNLPKTILKGMICAMARLALPLSYPRFQTEQFNDEKIPYIQKCLDPPG